MKTFETTAGMNWISNAGHYLHSQADAVGVAMELHGHTPEPVTLALIRPTELDAYRKHLSESNPDMRHATIGQLAIGYANRIFQNVTISPYPWTFNASTNEYSKA